MSATPTLKKALSQRQLTMIAIGGVIGAGLFVGSGVVIGDTGPGAFITYGLAGVLIIMVMRMLAEMAVANPSTGSFADYARAAMGNWAGFSVGWLYWYFWVIVVGFEAIAGAKIIQYWIDIPLWFCSLILMILMTATNLFSVSSFGEFEFWFAGIKVAAIVAFIALGGLFVFGLWPDKAMDFSNLWSHGGFFPLGVMAVTVGVVTVIFSMVGAEIATIAAAESSDPERAVSKAANSVITAYRSVLRRLDVPAGDHPAVERRGSGRVALRRRVHRDGHPVRRPHHERRGVDGGAELSELGHVHRVAHAVRPRRTAGGAGAAGPGDPPRGSGHRDPRVLGGRLPVRHRRGHLAGHHLRVPAELQRRGHPVRLPAHRRSPRSCCATAQTTRSFGSRCGCSRCCRSSPPSAILAILVQMGMQGGANREALMLSLLSWAVVIALFFANRWFMNRRPVVEGVAPTERPHRVLVLANQTVGSDELLDELRRIGADRSAKYHVVVPASPIETGTAATHGPLDVEEATREIAQQRLDDTLATLRSENLDADGELGDYRPLRALAGAVDTFHPDQIVISTLPPEDSVWHRFDVVDRARQEHGVPVTHVVATEAEKAEPVA